MLGSVSEVVVTGPAMRRIAAIAERQRGYVARRQLLAAGLDAGTITRRVRAGVLIAAHVGVYAVGHAAPVAGGRETAALLAMRHGAMLSHRTAARLWGFPSALHDDKGARDDGRRGDSRTGDGRGDEGPIDVTVPGSPGGRPAGVRRHRSVILGGQDLAFRDGLPLTSPERTLLDLAVVLAPRELERDLEHALRQTRMTERSLTRLLARAGVHHGRRPLEQLLGDRAGSTFTRSEAEERFLGLVRAAGLPDPEANVRRHGYELDFLWPAAGLAVEIDGFAFHGGREAFEHDHRKDADLLGAGIVVTRATWRQLTDDGVATIVRIAQLLAARDG